MSTPTPASKTRRAGPGVHTGNLSGSPVPKGPTPTLSGRHEAPKNGDEHRHIGARAKQSAQLSSVYADITPGLSMGDTAADGGVDRESWGLRTETVGEETNDDDSMSIQGLKREHDRQITHYRNLLVRAQSASASSIHEMHMKLQDLQERYDTLRAEHAACGIAPSLPIRGQEGLGLIVGMRRMDKAGRMDILVAVLEGCHPSDIQSQIALLEGYRRSRFDVIGKVNDDLQSRILSFLDVKDILNLRLVSKSFDVATGHASLWRFLCRTLDGRIDRHAADSGDAQSGSSCCIEGSMGASATGEQEIMQIWHIPRLMTRQARRIESRETIPARAVSCLDYCPQARILAAGFHDTGRVQVWRQGSSEEYELLHTLNGHLHGIRAIAISGEHLVSAGADKAIVVWHWPTGEKIIKFGQQTNICLGLGIVEDLIVTMTVDGIIRVFSISQRDKVRQYKVDDILRQAGHAGSAEGGMMSCFSAKRGELACGNKHGVYKLRWPERSSFIPTVSSANGKAGSSPVPSSPSISPNRGRVNSMAPSTSGKCQLPVREPRTPQRTQAGPEEPATLSPLARRRMIPRKPSLPIFSPKKKAYDPIQEGKMGMQPDVSKAPTLLAVYDVKNVRRGVIGHNGSVIGATRFASRADATRQMYIMRDGQDAVPLSGRWSDNVAADDLLSAAKNPMSIVADEEKIIYGCADGSIVVVGFV